MGSRPPRERQRQRTCRPPGSVAELIPRPETPRTRGGVAIRWLKACTTDAGCRTAFGYRCDPVFLGCTIDKGLVLTMGRQASPTIYISTRRADDPPPR